MPNPASGQAQIEEDLAEGLVLDPVLAAGDEADEREVPGQRADADHAAKATAVQAPPNRYAEEAASTVPATAIQNM